MSKRQYRVTINYGCTYGVSFDEGNKWVAKYKWYYGEAPDILEDNDFDLILDTDEGFVIVKSAEFDERMSPPDALHEAIWLVERLICSEGDEADQAVNLLEQFRDEIK